MNEKDEFETEVKRAYQEISDAWEKFEDALYAEMEPLVKKLAEILDEIT